MESHILKFIYSEKATNFCEISTLLLSYVVPVKSKVEISQNFVAFSDYINFKCIELASKVLHGHFGSVCLFQVSKNDDKNVAS